VKFFIPHAKDKKEAEKVFQGIKKFTKKSVGWDATDRRIFSLTYLHDRKKYHSEVGKPDDRVNEEVVAILESVIRGEPVLVGKEEVKRIIDFEK